MTDHFFFYGTLIPQYAPDHLREILARFLFLGEGSVRGVLYDLGDYPGAVLDDRCEGRVFGAVFRLPENEWLLHELDAYEGFEPAVPELSLFVRKSHPISLNDGTVIDCWIYEYNGNPTGASIIASGRYGREDGESSQ